MRNLIHFWSSQVAIIGGSLLVENFMENVSNYFWIPVTMIAIFVASRTWPSEVSKALTPKDILEFRQQRYEFVLKWFEEYWGLLVIPILAAVIVGLVVAIRWAWKV